MSRNVFVLLIVLAMSLQACNLAAATESTPTPTEGGDNPPPTPAPPDTTEPLFTGPVQFVDTPQAQIGFFSIAEGVEEIWAQWNYFNMSADDTVRRVWYKDDDVWLEREEQWDFAKYGASGTVRDVSIFDREDGLDAGDYELHLFINGVEQDVSADGGAARFSIVASQDGN